MKGRISFISVFLACSICVTGQNSLRIFSAHGPIHVSGRNITTDTSAQAVFLVKGINSDTLSLNIRFSDNKVFPVVFYLMDKRKPVKGKEFSYRVVRDADRVRAIYMTVEDQPPPTK